MGACVWNYGLISRVFEASFLLLSVLTTPAVAHPVRLCYIARNEGPFYGTICWDSAAGNAFPAAGAGDSGSWAFRIFSA